MTNEELDNLIPSLCPVSWFDNSGDGCFDLYRCIFAEGHSGPHEYDLVDRIAEHQKRIKASIGIDYFPTFKFENVFGDVLEVVEEEIEETNTPGGGWNYRVIRKSNAPDPDEPFIYQIHEVYYNKSGDVVAYSSPMDPFGETLDELKSDLLMMRAAFCEPVLNEWELPGATEEGEWSETYDPLDPAIVEVVNEFVESHKSFTAFEVMSEVEQRNLWDLRFRMDHITAYLDTLFKNGDIPGYTREIRGEGDFYFHKSDYMAQQYAEHLKNRPYVCNAWGKFYVDNGEPVD